MDFHFPGINPRVKHPIYTCSVSDASTRIIVLESDETLAAAIATSIQGATGMTACIAASTTEAVTFIHDYPDTVFAVAANVCVSGTTEMFDLLTEKSIPSIAYGTDATDDVRKGLSTLNIAEVVFGDSLTLADNVGSALGKLVTNQDITILIVDDSRSMRTALRRFLTNQCYTVLEAGDGKEALAVLEQNPQVKLVITDNEMPNMNGFSLVRAIRRSYSKDDLAVIGISAKTNSMLSVKFINNGANDFLHKPFVKEELYCRVGHNVDMLNRIALIRDLSNKDPLTRLYNRRYFFEMADVFVNKMEARNKVVVAAMIDVDHFKKFNDTYGHEVGDTVLVKVSSVIKDFFDDNSIVSRFGGEEFCVLAAHDQDADVLAFYDTLRKTIETSPVEIQENDVSVTVSIGVCTERIGVRDMLRAADALLYDAKESGRNRVAIKQS